MDTVIFIVYIKTDEKYVDIAKDVDAIFETSNDIAALRLKTYRYLMDDDND